MIITSRRSFVHVVSLFAYYRCYISVFIIQETFCSSCRYLRRVSTGEEINFSLTVSKARKYSLVRGRRPLIFILRSHVESGVPIFAKLGTNHLKTLQSPSNHTNWIKMVGTCSFRMILAVWLATSNSVALIK